MSLGRLSYSNYLQIVLAVTADIMLDNPVAVDGLHVAIWVRDRHESSDERDLSASFVFSTFFESLFMTRYRFT